MKSSINSARRTFLLLALSASAATCTLAQDGAKKSAPPSFAPLVPVQQQDYLKARRTFHTKLLRQGPAPQSWQPLTPPAGVTQVEYPSGPLWLKAGVNQPTAGNSRRYPAVLFLHGGSAFGMSDWLVAQPFRDAGFVVMAPMLRGENGQPGTFSMFYDEVDDVVAAAAYLRHQRYVDRDRLFVAGHSVGGTMTLLAAMSWKHFRTAASFSASPDRVLFVNYAPAPKTASHSMQPTPRNSRCALRWPLPPASSAPYGSTTVRRSRTST